MHKTAGALLGLCLLSGCYTFRGPAPVLNDRDVVERDNFGLRHGFYYDRFRTAAYEAAECEDTARPVSPVAFRPINCRPQTLEGPERDRIMRNFMRTGFGLVIADCRRFFQVAGRNQARSRIVRDTISPLSNLLGGLLALRNIPEGGTDDVASILALGTSTATSGLDIFDQRFLFGAENIASVEQLILRTLTEHGSAALNQHDINFETASSEIFANQAICTPPHILRLSREAIQNGTPKARPEGTPAAGTGAPPVVQAPAPAPVSPGQGLSGTSVGVPPPVPPPPR
jgi:hypothetical protein